MFRKRIWKNEIWNIETKTKTQQMNNKTKTIDKDNDNREIKDSKFKKTMIL